MTAHLQLQGATIELSDEALTELARQVGRLQAPAVEPDGWIRGAQAAAEYLGCKRKRIYALVELERVERRYDGTVLMFRREWLDAALSRFPETTRG